MNTPSEQKTFVIIDALAIAYKSYFAFISRPLRNKKGENTSAVYGFLNQLIKIFNDLKPDSLAVAYDSKEKTFRHGMYDKYKSSRAQMPEDMIPQIQHIKDIVSGLGINSLIYPGYEADDIIGTSVKVAEAHGFRSIMVTPDKDYIQLLTDKTVIAKPAKSGDDFEFIDKSKALELYGFSSDYMIDYLSLIGDSSDDIPGVAGVGPKTAVPLINTYHTIESLYENIEQVSSNSVKAKLIAGKETAFLSKRLATIVNDMKLDLQPEDFKPKLQDMSKVRALCEELDFRNMFLKLEQAFNQGLTSEISNFNDEPIEEDEIPPQTIYTLITTKKAAEELASQLKSVDLLVFDTETDSLDTFAAQLAGVAFSHKPYEAFFVAIAPLIQDGELFEIEKDERLSLSEFKAIFSPLLSDSKVKKVCQNAKFDLAVLRNKGIEVNGVFFDTMIASYLIDPDQRHNMDDLALKYLNHTTIKLKDILGERKNATNIFKVDLHKLSEYSCEDADITYRLFEVLNKELIAQGLVKLANEIEFPLIDVLSEMERTGVAIDVTILKTQSKELELQIADYTQSIYQHAGVEFNLNSPQQLQKILFEKLHLPATKKTKTGYSTDAGTLELLADAHPIIDQLLEYRQLTKLKSTYIDALPLLIKPITGRIHTTYNQTIAATGRLSSVDPNLQNIPIRTEQGREIRKAFIPRSEEYTLLSLDYSQIELRIMASMSGDVKFIEAFKNREDIHTATAATVFGVQKDEVTSAMRRKAKEVNFGILYGIGAFGLKNRLKITQQQAKELIDNYFVTFPSVKVYIDETINSARERGFVETMLGRKRFLQNINSKNQVVRSADERIAINMPIQGTAADMIKIAMINIQAILKTKKTKMILQVHDELVFDTHKEELDELQPILIDTMQNALALQVPVIVEAGVGENWLEAH